MKTIFLISLMMLLLLTSGVATSKTHVLIYTKNETGEGKYVHDNIEASVKALQKICQTHEITADVSDDPSLFTPENLQHYEAIIFSNSNNQAFDTQAQRDAFQQYIKNGGRFMGIHSACASERDWPWFWAMVGGTFVRHPVLQEFDIKVIDSDHPSTRHLEDVWVWEDECYLLNHLNPDIKVVLAADLTTIEDEKLDEFPRDIFGDYFPLAWYHTFDGGRQFYTALGHKIEYYSDRNFINHLEGGLLWLLEK